MENLKYPIGRYKTPLIIKAATVKNWIEEIAAQPAKFRALVDGLTAEQLNLPYRPCLLYTSPSPRDATLSRMPSSA